MADEEPERVLTLKERMAKLNAAQVGLGSRDNVQHSARLPPQVPPNRPVKKQKSFNVPSENTVSTSAQPAIANTPRGPPPPLPTRKAPPPLPVRKQSQTSSIEIPVQEARVTATRTKSEEHSSRIKAPAWGDCQLPALPAKPAPKTRQSSFADRPQPDRKSSVSSIASSVTTLSNGSRNALPPPLPTRKSQDSVTNGSVQQRKMPPMPTTDMLEKARQASFGFGRDPEPVNQDRAVTSIVSKPIPSLPVKLPLDVSSLRQAIPAIPAIPTATRPDLSSIQATKPKVNNNSHLNDATSGCLVCRDFSAPDHHATLFPRQQVRSLQNLAHDLTSPFPSETDKARAIFTWLHHNIDYNTEAFFSGNIKSSTPSSTLQTGLAVCEGYAALFTNIATYAGLQSIVVSGHGKGFGFAALPPGAPLPPYEGNHAWNAVKIDEGWKLIDSCWGAGAVEGAGKPYTRRFAPERFTQSNEEFGLDHFPNNREHFFLPNNRVLDWEEYIQRNSTQWPYQFEPLTVFTNANTDYSIGQQTISPPNRKIEVRKPGSVRFQFGLFCPHWTLDQHSKKGPPPVFIMMTGGVDGRDKKSIPLEHVRPQGQSGGDMWYVDIDARELGAPGETLTMFAVTSFGNMQNARGLSVQAFKDGVGRTGMGFTGVAAWELI